MSEHKKICPFLGRFCEMTSCGLWSSSNGSCCLLLIAESTNLIEEAVNESCIQVAVYEGY